MIALYTKTWSYNPTLSYTIINILMYIKLKNKNKFISYIHISIDNFIIILIVGNTIFIR